MKKFLPLGSIVFLEKKGSPKMICGYLLNVNSKCYDYAVWDYPFGIESKKIEVCNHSDIQDIVFEGFKDEVLQQILKGLEHRRRENLC